MKRAAWGDGRFFTSPWWRIESLVSPWERKTGSDAAEKVLLLLPLICWPAGHMTWTKPPFLARSVKGVIRHFLVRFVWVTSSLLSAHRHGASALCFPERSPVNQREWAGLGFSCWWSLTFSFLHHCSCFLFFYLLFIKKRKRITSCAAIRMFHCTNCLFFSWFTSSFKV